MTATDMISSVAGGGGPSLGSWVSVSDKVGFKKNDEFSSFENDEFSHYIPVKNDEMTRK